METTQDTYQTTAQAYVTGVRSLLSPTIMADQPQRGTDALFSPEGIAARAVLLVPISRDLTRAATDRLSETDPSSRSDASTQLIAKALVDFQVSAFLFQAAQEQDHGKTMIAQNQAERGAVIMPSVEEQLTLILGDSGKETQFLQRSPDMPKDIQSARGRLKQAVSDALTLVEQRAGRTGQAALSGLLTIGVGQLAQAAGIVTLNIAQTIGAAEKVTQLYILFRQFFTNAYNALVAALGPAITQTVANQVVGWVNEMLQGEKFSILLSKMYETGQTRQELHKSVDISRAGLEEYCNALEKLETLNAQYLKQIGIIEKMITALRFISGVPVAALPQSRLLLGATYIVISGYVIFAGADYVDAPHFTRLDRIPGPTKIINSALSDDLPKEMESSGETGSSPPDLKPSDEGEAPPETESTVSNEGNTTSSQVEPITPASPGNIDFSMHTVSDGTDQIENQETTSALKDEKIRLDLAVPEIPVVVGEAFEIAVAIRRPRSALLSLEGLDSVTSSNGTIYRRAENDIVRYRVKVSASNCEIDTPDYTFLLRAGKDSEPCFFHLTPLRSGNIYITVTAYQDDDLLITQTRRQLQAVIASVEPSQASPDNNRQVLIAQLEKETVIRQSSQKSSKEINGKEFINFDINLYDYIIDENQRESYKVNVESRLSGDRNLEDPDLVVIPEGLRQSLRMLDNRKLNSGEIAELGKVLGNLLLPPKARRYFELSRARLDEDQALRVRIKTGVYPLASIAWEFSYILPEGARPNYSGEEGFLALDKRISIVRYEVMGKPLMNLDPLGSRQLRMVMLLANPDHPLFPKLALDQEEKNIREALKNVTDIHLEVFLDASIQTLEDALINPAHIFHFSGHGSFVSEMGEMMDTEVGKGCLILQEDDPEDCFFPAVRLASTLKDCGVRLAVLGVCEGGERDVENAWSGIAAALSYAGIPAVVAMQFRIFDKSALYFHRMFYRTLAAGHSIDAAVANGRQAIANRLAGDRDWGVPVLYLRADEEGVLFPVEE